MAWFNMEHGNEVHVVPLDDVIAHEFVDCVCGTTTEPEPRKDGSMGWVIIHQALDGRE